MFLMDWVFFQAAALAPPSINPISSKLIFAIGWVSESLPAFNAAKRVEISINSSRSWLITTIAAPLLA
jgi:hypothetical protein